MTATVLLRAIARKLVFALYFALTTIFLLELGVRLWGYSEHEIYDPMYMPFARTGEVPYVQKPNLRNARGRGLSIVYR